MLSTKFEFQFEFDDFTMSEEWTFVIHYEDSQHDTLYDMSVEEFFLDFWGEMEAFGVHDFFGHPGTMFGFGSYEIKQQDKTTVLEKWRQFFIDLGYTCDPWVNTKKLHQIVETNE